MKNNSGQNQHYGNGSSSTNGSTNTYKYSLLNMPPPPYARNNMRKTPVEVTMMMDSAIVEEYFEDGPFTLVKEPSKKPSLKTRRKRVHSSLLQRQIYNTRKGRYTEEEKIKNMKETFRYNANINRNMLLGLTASFAAVTFAATSDFGLDNNVDKTIRDSITSILTVILVAVLVIIVPLLHAYNMYEYGKLTGAPVNWWWYIFPFLLLLIGIIPIITYIILLFT